MPIKGTYYNATLGAAPTTTDHLGYTLSSGTISGTATNGTLASISITNAGTYVISYSLNGNMGTTPTVFSVTISGNNATNYNNGFFTFQTGYFCITGSDILTCTASSSIALSVYIVGGSGISFISSQCFFKTVRIG